MKSYTVQRIIHAPAPRIWQILTQAQIIGTPAYGICRIEGEVTDGAKIKLWSEVDPKRAFTLRVALTEPGTRMDWTGGMPLGLFRGTRTFTLAPVAQGTLFTMTERFTGLLSGPITRAMPDLQPSFDQFAAALEKDSTAPVTAPAQEAAQ